MKKLICFTLLASVTLFICTSLADKPCDLKTRSENRLAQNFF